jgi:hypothetical protein
MNKLQPLIPFRFSGFINKSKYVDIDRTVARAAATADAGNHAIFSNVVRIFMAKFLS